MFNNVGGKIKALVQVTFVMTCVAAGLIVLIFFMIACDNGGGAWLGFLFSILGAAVLIFFSWIGSFVLYGYGEMVENSDITQQYIKKIYDELHDDENDTTHNTGSYGSGMSNFRQQALGVNHTCWTCKNCKEDNPNTSVFCQNCGTHR